MRSLVITAVILFFNIAMSVLVNVAPGIYNDTPVPVNINQTIVTNMTDSGQIVSQDDYQNTYYGQQISVTSTLWSIVTGTIFCGGTLHKMGMDWTLAQEINIILGILVTFDLYTLWKGTPW